MNGRSLGPAWDAGACLHQSLGGSSDHEPSLPCGITSRLAGIRGGPQGAVSDVGDPTERLTSLAALRLATHATLYGSRSDAEPAQGVSPDPIDSSTRAASPPRFLRTSGRIELRVLGPRPRSAPVRGRGAAAAGCRRADGPRLRPPSAAFLGTCTAGYCRAGSGGGSWAAARSRLDRVVSSLIL